VIEFYDVSSNINREMTLERYKEKILEQVVKKKWLDKGHEFISKEDRYLSYKGSEQNNVGLRRKSIGSSLISTFQGFLISPLLRIASRHQSKRLGNTLIRALGG
jgi:hypothetical protein